MRFEWPTVRFGDLLSEGTRNGLNRPKRVRGAGFPMVNMGELFAYSRIRNIEMDLVPVSDREMHYLLQPGDLLFARQSLVFEGAGKCSIFLGNHKPTVFESHLIRCRLDHALCDPQYYYYFFQSIYGKNEMRSIVEQGASVAGIRGSDLVNLRVPHPTRDIQTRVASILSMLDDRIDLLSQTDLSLQSIAQAIFKSWFIDFDPVHAKAAGQEPIGMDAETAALFPREFEDSELGPIPKGWRSGTIEDIARNVVQSVEPRSLDRSTPYIGLEHMPRGSIGLNAWGMAGDVQSAKRAFQTRDILFGRLRPYFRKVGIAPVDGICSTDILVLRPNDEAMHGFLTVCVSSREVIDYATRVSTGARMPRVSWKDLSEYPIAIPSDVVAKEYQRVIAPLFDRILANVTKAQILADLRDTLLPRLISGKLRLPEAEAIVEEAVS